MFLLDEEQRLILQSVREIVQKEIKPRAAPLDESGDFPWEAVRIFARNDLLNPLLPREVGGVEVSSVTFCMILEEIAKVCASSALLLITQAEGTLPIIYGGGPTLKEKYLKRLTGDSRVLVALGGADSAAGSGGDLSLKTEALLKGETYLLNGVKCFVTNGSVADFMVLYAFTNSSSGNREISAFVVEKTFPGLTIKKNEDRMGLRGSIKTEMAFNNLEVPKENRIGREGEGFPMLMKTLHMSQLFIAAQSVGLAQGAMEEAISYARNRVQFGKPISHFAPVQCMIAEMAIGIESARLLTYKTAWMVDHGENNKVGAHAAMARCMASDMAMKVTTDAVQIMGGYGYMKDYPVERMMRDAKYTQIHQGTSQIMRLVVGRNLTGISS